MDRNGKRDVEDKLPEIEKLDFLVAFDEIPSFVFWV
jgi:hypothetical protein